MRRAVPVVAVVLGVALGTASPAFAHGARSLVDVHTRLAAHGAVGVAADVSFVDGDPVPDARLLAVATKGATTSPVELAAAGKPGHFAGSVRLTPGAWVVTVHSVGTSDSTEEAIGSSSVTVHVAAAGSSTTGPAALGAGAAAVLLAGLGLAWGRRRRTRATVAEPAARESVGV